MVGIDLEESYRVFVVVYLSAVVPPRLAGTGKGTLLGGRASLGQVTFERGENADYREYVDAKMSGQYMEYLNND